jgi:hypothetical protein
MPAPTICPSCRAVRAPNARFCLQCGHDYEALTSRSSEWVPPDPRKIEIEVSVMTGIKFGFELAVGASIVGLLVSVASLGMMAAMLDALTRPFR